MKTMLDSSPRGHMRGSTLVEFALILPVLLILTFLVVDLSRAFGFKNVVTQAAREGSRVAVVTSYNAPDSLQPRAQRRAQAILGASYAGCTATVVGGAGNENIQVVVKGQFKWLYPGLLTRLGISGLTNPDTLAATTVMRWEK
jgi:Flp pilus assembly protein TadG